MFVYGLADGKFINIETVLKQNYRLALWFKSVEKRNKKTAIYHDWGKYNINEYTNSK